MAKVNPSQAADKWRRRLTSATQDIQAGVQRVQENPAQKAAAAQEKLVQRFNQAVQSGKWRAGLERVTLQDWKRATIEKGIPRISQGAQEGQSKVQEFMADLLPHVDAGLNELNNMPDLTLEDSINRAAFWIRHMSRFSRQ